MERKTFYSLDPETNETIQIEAVKDLYGGWKSDCFKCGSKETMTIHEDSDFCYCSKCEVITKKEVEDFSLSSSHLEDLQKSGLNDNTIKEAGVYSVPPQDIEKGKEIDLSKDLEDTGPDPDIFEGDPFEDETWIKLYRKLRRNPIYKDSIAVHLFVHLLLTANHKPNRFIFNEKEITVKRGQLVTGRKQISSETDISEWAVRKRLKLFEKFGILTRKTTSKFSIITICNYKHYQGMNYKNSPDISPAGDGCQTSSISPAPHQHLTTNKNVRSNNIGRASQKKDVDPKVKEFLKYWSEIFLRETGKPCVINWGKDGTLIKGLLRVHDLTTLQDITKDFFKDERCQQRGLDIGIFKLEVNRLVGLKGMNPIEQVKREMRARQNI